MSEHSFSPENVVDNIVYLIYTKYTKLSMLTGWGSLFAWGGFVTMKEVSGNEIIC